MNHPWHAQNPLRLGASLDARVEWHERHAVACGCRPIPQHVLEEIRRRRARPLQRRHDSPDPRMAPLPDAIWSDDDEAAVRRLQEQSNAAGEG